jgi:hypothetical protein
MHTLWRAATRFHNWNDRRFPAMLIDRAAAVGALGPATWAITPEDTPVRQVDFGGPDMGAQLLALVRPRSKILYLKAGGDGWYVLMVVPPFVRATNRLNGIGVVALVFDRPSLEDAAGSARLWSAFRATHTPEDTEYAMIHPEERWHELRGTAYNPAVTYDPMFAGAAWANFLGPGHVEQFDRTALGSVKAEWLDRGVFFRDAGPLGEATSAAAEARMLAVTEAFRRARRS